MLHAVHIACMVSLSCAVYSLGIVCIAFVEHIVYESDCIVCVCCLHSIACVVCIVRAPWRLEPHTKQTNPASGRCSRAQRVELWDSGPCYFEVWRFGRESREFTDSTEENKHKTTQKAKGIHDQKFAKSS